MNAQDERVFVRFRNIDPEVDSYSYEQMTKALAIEKYQDDFKSCAPVLEKYFRLEGYKKIIENPTSNVFSAYLRAIENRHGSDGLYAYADELMPFPEYNAGMYMAANEYEENYRKIGINLRDESANSFTSIFDWYRKTRLKTGSSSQFVVEKMDPVDFSTLQHFLKDKWGSKLGPQADYRIVIKEFYEVQLSMYVERQLTAIYPSVLKETESTLPSCKEIFLKALKESAEKSKIESMIASGTYKDDYSVLDVTAGQGNIRVVFSYKVEDSKGSGYWFDCKIDGNTVTGEWTAQHDDKTKSGTRKGTVAATFDGTSITGEYLEDTPAWNYKPGYSAANVSSRMVKGKKWPFTFKKQ